ncbi:MlaD family protein [Antrihabitans sp. NCIMB 15449]|uniref:MlaD family protein n=1 Tax=Antrihabitans spumae TaxID=3373370 RepID=A0ABW7JWG5_9NOCA
MTTVRKRNQKRTVVTAFAVVGMLTTAGCGLTVEKLPLPKPGVGGDSYTLNAQFTNALNLPDQAKVKVGGSDVGVVTDITTSNFVANIEMKIRDDVKLPEGTRAELRQATPLGDVFVALQMAPDTGGKTLGNGDSIKLEQTSTGASVEELLLSVSLLLNGGAINKISSIVDELDSAVGGKGPVLSHLIVEMTNVVGSLNANTDRVDSVLREFDETLATLNQRKGELGDVAASLPAMISTLAENNQAIGDLVQKVSVTTAALGDFSNTTGTQMRDLLDSTDKLMTGLAQTRDTLGPAMDALHSITPKVAATAQGSTLAVAATVQYLSIAALWGDPTGSRLPDGSDLNALAGSFIEVLQKVYQRLNGGTR